MPTLSPELEKLLAFVPAAEREGMTKIVTGLHENGLRQEEFSRKMNEVQDLKQRYEKGNSWVDDNRAYYKEAIAQRDAAAKKAADLENIVSSLKSGQAPGSGTPGAQNFDIKSIDMDDPEKVAAAIAQANREAAEARADARKLSEHVTKINDLLEKGQLVTREQFDLEGGKKLESYGQAIMNVMDTVNKAMIEYGKPISRDALLVEADKNGGNLTVAYENLTKEWREEKMKNEWLVAERKKWEEEQAEKGFPTAPGSAPIGLGPMQKMVFQGNKSGDESAIDPSIKADGSGRLAHAIAQELRQEGKA
jgi:hypothetical protein